jgi:hypothetical protein
MTRAKDISKIVTDADLSGTLDVTGAVTAGGLTVQDASAGRVLTGIFQNTTNAAGTSSGISLQNSADTTSVNLTAERVGSNAGADLVVTGFDNTGVEKNFMRITEGNDISFYEDTGTTPKLFWDASEERLGIGTSSPSETLTVAQGTIERAIAVCSSDANVGGFIGASGDAGSANKLIINGSRGSGAIIFQTVSDEKMRIDSDGAVEIGTYSATGVTRGFIVDPGVNANGYRIRSSVLTSSNLSHYQFANTNGVVGGIRTNGTATAYDTSSDHRLKENVTADWDATTRLKQLNPVRFNFIADADTTVDGFLAHEVQSVVPEAISGTHNEVEVWQDGEELPDGVSVGDNKLDEDGNTIPVYQGIDQSKLVPLLVKTIQELEARIVALETA